MSVLVMHATQQSYAEVVLLSIEPMSCKESFGRTKAMKRPSGKSCGPRRFPVAQAA